MKYMLTSLLVLIFLFYVLWGLNYARQGLKSELGLSVDKNNFDIEIYGYRIIQKLNILRKNNPSFAIDSLNVSVDIAFKKMGDKLFLPLNNTPVVRALKPKGFLLHFGTSGVYFPWTGEANYDSGLHPLEWPTTIMHELGHSSGFTDEGECNLFSFMACMNSDDAYFQYSSWLNLWFYIRKPLYRLDKKLYFALLNNMSDLVLNDINSVIKNGQKYPDFVPKLRYIMYDTYLKANGVKKGVKSYADIILSAWSLEKLDFICP